MDESALHCAVIFITMPDFIDFTNLDTDKNEHKFHIVNFNYFICRSYKTIYFYKVIIFC